MSSPFIWGSNSQFDGVDPYPNDVYAFLDVDHPVVAWSIQRGALVSADYASSSGETLGLVSMMTAGMIVSNNGVRLFNELVIEGVRLRRFSQRTSRIRGMYFFRSREEARNRIGDPMWPDYFREACLVRLRLWTHRPPTIVDANWITHAPLRGDGRLNENALDWIDRYWAGDPWGPDPVWEVIAEGVAIVLDEELRRLCYAATIDSFPLATIPILMARLASEAGTRGGLVTPFLFREDHSHVRLEYVLSDAEFHDPEVIDAIAAHPDSGALFRMMSENQTWQTLDLRPWGGRMSLVEGGASSVAEERVIHG